MKKLSALLGLVCMFIVLNTSLAIGGEKSNGTGKTPQAVKENEMINAQLDHIDKSIDKLKNSISKTPINKQEYKSSNAEVATTVNITGDKSDSEIIKQRLKAIENSISNIGKALADSKTEIGSNCYFVDVCTSVVCIRYSAPPDVSGGTPVCVESECRAWETRFVCK